MMKGTPICSRCGSSINLNLVILPYLVESPSGRVLVYCDQCREDYKGYIGKSISLEKVSKKTFLELYRSGLTTSDPQTAVEIVFGKEDFELIHEATRLLSVQKKH